MHAQAAGKQPVAVGVLNDVAAVDPQAAKLRTITSVQTSRSDWV